MYLEEIGSAFKKLLWQHNVLVMFNTLNWTEPFIKFDIPQLLFKLESTDDKTVGWKFGRKHIHMASKYHPQVTINSKGEVP